MGTGMSDTSGGPGWWLASDGKWYPPESKPSTPPPPPASHRRKQVPRKRRWAVVVALGAAAAIVAIVLVVTGGSSQITSKGALELDDFNGNCLLDSGFSDITEGAQVVVTNSSGSVIGTTSLSYNGPLSSAESKIQKGMSVCVYPFTVTVPGALSRYGITVSHRGTVWFSAAQMAKGPGLSLGSSN